MADEAGVSAAVYAAVEFRVLVKHSEEGHADLKSDRSRSTTAYIAR